MNVIQVIFLDKSEKVLGSLSLVMNITSEMPISFWLLQKCLGDTAIPPTPEGTAVRMPENIITISKVKNGAIIEYNGVVVVNFDVTVLDYDKLNRTTCEEFLRWDVQNVQFLTFNTFKQVSFRQSGEWEFFVKKLDILLKICILA